MSPACIAAGEGSGRAATEATRERLIALFIGGSYLTQVRIELAFGIWPTRLFPIMVTLYQQGILPDGNGSNRNR